MNIYTWNSSLNIYTRKRELSEFCTFLQALFFLLFVVWVVIYFLYTSQNSKYLIWLLIIFGIILLTLQKASDTLTDEIDNIRKTLSRNFWEEEMLTMIETFNDEQFNKILEVSRSLDKNNEEIEKNNFNKRIQKIKDKYNI